MLLLGPMLLLGLFLAGLIHVLISRHAILRWLRRDSLKSIAAAAAVGVPMPLCSCSVVPVVAEMRRKGASRSACLSFLITAPETGADSILVTQAFFGPAAAVVRPVLSFVTAVVTGLCSIGLIRGEDRPRSAGEAAARNDDHCHDHCAHTPLVSGRDDCYVALADIRKSLALALGSAGRRLRLRSVLRRNRGSRPPPDAVSQASTAPPFATIARHVLRYGFVEVADDILFALLVGVALGGLLYLAIPADLMAHEYARWLAYPAMVLVGVPLYICASASTPIAAALVAKGFSPGAALVFLMTGPATNTGTIAVVVSQFGSRLAAVYVGAVVGVTVVLGIAIDVLLLLGGWSLAVNLDASTSPAVATLQWGGALGLVALVVWRFRAGAFKSGYKSLLGNLRPGTAALREPGAH